jgi:TolB protein
VTATVETTGSNLDADGYTLALDNGTPQDVADNGSVTFKDVAVGSHTVTLDGVASNCMADPAAPASVSVQANATASAGFRIECGVVMDGSGGTAATPDGKARVDVPSGALTDSTVISVVPAPDSLLPSPAPGYVTGSAYQYRPDGTQFSKPVQITIVYDPANVPSGASESSIRLHTVQNGQWVPVTGSTVDTTLHTVTGQATHFSIYGAVASQPGVLKAASATSGANLDPDGYHLVVDGGAGTHLGINDTVAVAGLSVGDHTVQLDSVASNCTVSGSNPRTVSVPAQDTITTTFAVSCSSQTGDLHVTTSTSGTNLDPDGYAVRVDGGAYQHIAINDSLTLQGLAAGSHSVLLDSVAANCTVAGGATHSITVPDGGTVTAAFDVTCSANVGNIKVKAPTTGPDADSSYQVTLDGTLSQTLAANDSVTFANAAVGTHSIELTNVAGNCSVSGSNPQNVDVTFDSTSTATFDVSCVSLTGDIKVRTETSGTDLDADGYTIALDGGSPSSIGINDSVTYASLTAGDHTVTLGNVAANCSLGGSNTMTVTAPHGGVVDTAFVVSCAPNVGSLQVSNTTSGSNLDAGYQVSVDSGPSQFMTANGSITVDSLSVGSHSVEIYGIADNCAVQDSNPRSVTIAYGATTNTSFSVGCVAAMSNKIVFETNRDGNFEIYRMNLDGTAQANLTSNPSSDRTPAVSPDGNQILFTSDRSGALDIWTMLADGSGQRDLSNSGNADRNPQWSPDGSAIAFDRSTGGVAHIYTMKADGTNQTQITSGANFNDVNPDWSPDGSKIAFARSENGGKAEIYVYDFNTSSLTNVSNDSSGNDFDPAWSPDGTKIVFAADRNGNAGDIYVMNADGSGQTQLTTDPNPDYRPVWSADGTKIIFTALRVGGIEEIYIMNADGSNQTDLSNDPSHVDDNADVSP